MVQNKKLSPQRNACCLQALITKLEKRIQETEKQNQDLHWQIAMLAKDPEAPPLQNKAQHQAASAFQEAAGSNPTLFSRLTHS